MSPVATQTNLARLQTALQSSPFDVLHVSNVTNCQWLSGFSGSSCSVFVSKSAAVFVTDSRYTIQAEVEVTDMPVRWHQAPKTSEEMWEEVLSSIGARSVGYEDSQTVARLARTKDKLPGYEWVKAADYVKPLRMRKTPQEVVKIQAACALADRCLEHVQRMLQVGVSELDVSLDIEFFFSRHGATCSFAPIVASGPNSARPHAGVSERKL